MKRNHALLCVLSKQKPSFAKRSADYEAEDGGSYSGIQSNEAAVKYLLHEAKADGVPVDEIDYLCSKKCLEADIKQSKLPDSFPLCSGQEEYTSEEFFIGRIEQYCSENGIDIPAFNRIDFVPDQPTSTLKTLISLYGSGNYRISIDLTGGPRDTAVLLTLAIEAYKLCGTQIELGPIAYASYDPEAQHGLITGQNSIFEYVDLVHAIDAFKESGQVGKLCSLLSGNDAGVEARALCKSLREFSEALAVCQVGDIELKVNAVNVCLDEFIEAAGADPVVSTLAHTIKDGFISCDGGKSPCLLDAVQWCVDRHMIPQAITILLERMPEILMDMGYIELKGKPPYHARKTKKNRLKSEPETVSIREMLNRCELSKNGVNPSDGFGYFTVADNDSLSLAYLYYAFFQGVRNAMVHANDKKHSADYKIACKYFGLEQSESLKLGLLERMIRDAIEDIRLRKPILEDEWSRMFKIEKNA